MAQSIDPLQSFTYLVDNIPQWLTKLDELNVQCDEQYERFYKLTKHGQVKLTRKKKHDSTESLRPKNEDATPLNPPEDIQEEPLDPNTTPKDSPSPVQPTQLSVTPIAPTDLNRKRKPGSDLSVASGPNKYRTKSMIVVYYDSAIQTGFEGVVKNIANGRSTLRKGRNTATFHSRMASIGLPTEHDSPSFSDAIDPRSMIASLNRSRAVDRSAADKQNYKSFDEADRDLEEAQNLSERAAHQFLRDGDSNVEIEGMRKRFKAVLRVAEKEAQRLSKGNEELPGPTSPVSTVVSGAGKVTPSLPTDPSFDTTISSKIEPSPIQVDDQTPPTTLGSSYEALDARLKLPIPHASKPEHTYTAPTSGATSTKQLNFPAMGTIEVDDSVSDASSVKVDISAIRRVTRRA